MNQADYSSVSISHDIVLGHLDRIVESIFILQDVYEVKDDTFSYAVAVHVTQRVFLFAERSYSVTHNLKGLSEYVT